MIKEYKDIQIKEGINNGLITISEEVVKALIGIAVRQVAGAIDTKGTFYDDVLHVLGRVSLSKGIKLEIEKESFNVEVNVLIEKEAEINKVVMAIQNIIRNILLDKIGITVKIVTVIVQGVKYRSEDILDKVKDKKFERENKEYFEESTSSIRRIKYKSEKELAGIVAKKVDGVFCMAGTTIIDFFAAILGFNYSAKGVNITKKGREVIINLNIVIEAKSEIYKVAYIVKNDVQKALEYNTGLKIKKVNVNVLGIKYNLENEKLEIK